MSHLVPFRKARWTGAHVRTCPILSTPRRPAKAGRRAPPRLDCRTSGRNAALRFGLGRVAPPPRCSRAKLNRLAKAFLALETYYRQARNLGAAWEAANVRLRRRAWGRGVAEGTGAGRSGRGAKSERAGGKRTYVRRRDTGSFDLRTGPVARSFSLSRRSVRTRDEPPEALRCLRGQLSPFQGAGAGRRLCTVRAD